MRSQRKKNDSSSLGCPQWDGSGHDLYWRGRLVKHFKHDAPMQEAILEKFQASSWTEFLEISSLDDTPIQSKKQLHATIESLNRSLKGAIHFHQEGSGSRICWEPGK